MKNLSPNMLGAYGPWAASLTGDGPARLSFLHPDAPDLESQKQRGRNRAAECLLSPDLGPVPRAVVDHKFEYDGLDIELLHWQLPFGPPTEAVFLKPAGATGRLPAVLGLHDHGGNKYFGHRKITRVAQDQHPRMIRHQQEYYGGVPWANELAKRGYAVLVHDVFTFGSRRVRVADLPDVIRENLVEVNPESETEIDAYNQFASRHEHLVAKSLFSAGTTWPGTVLGEDQVALGYLCSRPDVDPSRVGCAGLSGGGLRTVYLAGLDDRIQCACCAGMMTTWRDYLLNKCHTHTWMIYIPQLPLDLDYPEILGLRAPLPTMVLSCEEDSLFTRGEMQRAHAMLADVYQKANATNRFQSRFYPGGHKFDLPMQADAFAFFDHWLKQK